MKGILLVKKGGFRPLKKGVFGVRKGGFWGMKKGVFKARQIYAVFL